MRMDREWHLRPARRGDRGSGFARARKQSQAVIVGGVSLEAAPPARQDDAETASIIVNGRKGLNEHSHVHVAKSLLACGFLVRCRLQHGLLVSGRSSVR